tara:strand:+ start:2515 stop:2967 length:453 start_codon:yes stop_codon:yes gene_type:complete
VYLNFRSFFSFVFLLVVRFNGLVLILNPGTIVVVVLKLVTLFVEYNDLEVTDLGDTTDFNDTDVVTDLGEAKVGDLKVGLFILGDLTTGLLAFGDLAFGLLGTTDLGSGETVFLLTLFGETILNPSLNVGDLIWGDLAFSFVGFFNLLSL